jgi:hypothetical protein
MISPSHPLGGGTFSRTTQVLSHKASRSADTSFPVPGVIPPSLSQKRIIALDASIQLRDGCLGSSFCFVGPRQTRSGLGLCTRRLNAVESRGYSLDRLVSVRMSPTLREPHHTPRCSDSLFATASGSFCASTSRTSVARLSAPMTKARYSPMRCVLPLLTSLAVGSKEPCPS